MLILKRPSRERAVVAVVPSGDQTAGPIAEKDMVTVRRLSMMTGIPGGTKLPAIALFIDEDVQLKTVLASWQLGIADFFYCGNWIYVLEHRLLSSIMLSLAFKTRIPILNRSRCRFKDTPNQSLKGGKLGSRGRGSSSGSMEGAVPRVTFIVNGEPLYA